MSGPASSAPSCHACTAPGLEPITGYGEFHRVTSDCQPWPAGGQLGVCGTCGLIQKVIDPVWLDEISRIYSAYNIYEASGGIEQAVFDQGSGEASPRSMRLVRQVQARVTLPAQGRMLDVGCGNGALMRAFSQALPRWSLAGTELNDKYRAVVEDIPRVEALHTCAPGLVPGTFDLVTLMHALEHIPDPVTFLGKLADKLPVGGRLLVEVPDHAQNPFDLLIADHSSHFTAGTLAAVVASAGFEVEHVVGTWLPKELTLIARKTGRAPAPVHPPQPRAGTLSTRHSLAWLRGVVDAAQAAAAAGRFGLFGTSIAGTWLDSELGDRVAFFVDEDPHRAGRRHFGRPILHPRSVPAGHHVFLGLPHPLAASIKERLAQDATGAIYHLPPPFPA
jgi:2-polyprenyl-3-methyl-5-hydroxy-6-metoxy-1,4-benzoquinol methylase